MKSNKGNRVKRFRIDSIMKIICIFLILLLIFQVAFIYITVSRIRDDTQQQVERTTDVFVKKTDKVLGEVYDRLRKLVLTNTDVRNINILTNSMDILNAKRNVAASLQEIQELYGNSFGVFIYDSNSEDYYHGWTSGWDYGIYKKTVHELMLHILSGPDKKANWSTVTINGVVYVFGYVFYVGYYACALISEKNLFQLQDFSDEEGIQNLEASLVTAGEPEAAASQYNKASRSGQIAVVRDLKQADFDVRIVSGENAELKQLVALQLITWVASAILVLLPVCSFVLMKKHVIDPLKYFSENLIRYETEGDGAYFEDSRIYELEEANKLFKKNLENMKALKIRMYEETLEKQRIEMEYTKLQINPHFYINCMNQIYNMACMEDYESIQKMATNISEYFRYIFREKSDYVDLAQELKHIEIYLDMCRLRYGKNFTYGVEITQDVSDIKIPPLLLHTFVENSVKYGTGKEFGNTIDVRVERFTAAGKELVTIEISDSGCGFPADLLERLQRGEQKVDPDGTKVGITNAIYRLNCLYEGEARLNFFNREDSGAVVKLCLPVCRTPKLCS